MTKADLQGHNIGQVVTTPGFQAALVYLTENVPEKTAGIRDATTIINDEGVLRGYLKAVHELRTIHKSAATAPKEPVKHYQPPTAPESK